MKGTKLRPSIEQDMAAGTREARLIIMENGKVRKASVAIRTFPSTHRNQYAYLQYKFDGKTVTKYICKVGKAPRSEALKKAWEELKKKGILEQTGARWFKT